MLSVLRIVPACVLVVGLLAVSAPGADKIRVVTTTTDLKALTEAVDRKSTRLNSSHMVQSRMPSSA